MSVRDVGWYLRPTEGTTRIELAEQAEASGVESVWLGERWESNAFFQLGQIVERTDNIRLGTGIINAFTRTPAVIAMGLASVPADRDFVLGVGPSTPAVVEELHGIEYERPIRHLHETVTLLKRYTNDDGERVNYDGEVYTVSDIPPLEADVPVFNAALGPMNRRLTGRLCDGWLPHLIPFSELESCLEEMRAEAADAGRDLESFEVNPWFPAYVKDDPELAKDELRAHVAYYAGASHGYRNAVASTYPENAVAIGEAWESGDREGAAAHVSDEMLPDFGVAGTPEMAREQCRDVLAATPIDVPILFFHPWVDDECIRRTRAELSPDLL